MSRAEVEERLRRSETVASMLDDGDITVYQPEQVVGVCTAGTLSSAFAGVAGLQTLGADIVGTPPGQAPRSFGEMVEQELPNTGLTVTLSGAMYEWVPDPDGRVLELDRTLTGSDFESYRQARDAELRLAFDYTGVTDGRPAEPVS